MGKFLGPGDVGSVETVAGGVVTSPVQLVTTGVGTHHELAVDAVVSPLAGQDVEGADRVRGEVGQVGEYPPGGHPDAQSGIGARADAYGHVTDVGQGDLGLLTRGVDEGA